MTAHQEPTYAPAAIYAEFRDIGHDIFLAHLISSHGGNMSLRDGDVIYITRTGSMLGRLSPTDVVQVPLEGPSEADAYASSELVVHRAIYAATKAGAVVHTHSPHTILRSMLDDAIQPIDSEARLFLPNTPVVVSQKTVGSDVAARLLSEALTQVPVAVLRGHGPFACGDTLEQAYHWVSVLECSSELLTMAEQVGRPLKDYLDG